MPKTIIETHFDTLVTKVIWPHFKRRGYHRSGNNFRRLHNDDSGKILQFQKSTYYDKNHINFTINCGIYLPDSWPFATGPNFTEPECLIRKRIGYLKPNGQDLWYDLAPGTDHSAVFAAVEFDVLNYALPFLDRVQSSNDVTQLLLSLPELSDDHTRIRALYAHGYQSEAKQQLQSVLAGTTSVMKRQFLLGFTADLNL